MITKPLVNVKRNCAAFFHISDGEKVRLLAKRWTMNQVEPYAFALDYPSGRGFKHFYLKASTAKSIRSTMRRAYRDAGMESPV